MIPINVTMLELLSEERLREQREEFERLHLLASVPGGQRSNLRGALASALVRWGLRLDPSAAERVPSLELAPAASKGRQQSS